MLRVGFFCLSEYHSTMSGNYSSLINTSIGDDLLFWRRPTPMNCETVRIIGIFLCLAAFSGLIVNGSILICFVRYKALRTPANIFIMFMLGVGCFVCCANMPLSGTSSIFCYWLYGRAGCQIEGLAAFLYGCASCYLLCAISLSRCYIVIRPFNAKNVTVSLIFKQKHSSIRNSLGYQVHCFFLHFSVNCINLDYIATCWLE